MEWSVLAVDQSMTSTGWAHLRRGDDKPTWGVLKFPGWGDNEGEYLWKWLEWIGGKLTDTKATHLFLENTFNPQDHHESLTDRIAQYGLLGQAAVATYLCGLRGQEIDYSLVTPGQWRPKFIGAQKPPEGIPRHQRRKWLKDKARDACAKRGWLVDSDDEADALGILAWSCAQIDTGFAVKQGPLFRRAEAAVEEEARSLR
jgi:hypothetical protein